MYACMHACMYVCMIVYVRIHIYIHISVYMYICIVFACSHVMQVAKLCINYIYICIHIIQRHTHLPCYRTMAQRIYMLRNVTNVALVASIAMAKSGSAGFNSNLQRSLDKPVGYVEPDIWAQPTFTRALAMVWWCGLYQNVRKASFFQTRSQGLRLGLTARK